VKYTCLIVDDNLIERKIVAFHLGKLHNFNVRRVCESGEQAATVLQTEKIDIVFSDIDMPDLSGVALLKSLKNPPVFIFITSHPEYALESFDLDVIDFIIKPFSFERFLKAANKAVEYLELKKLWNNNEAKEQNLRYHSAAVRNDRGDEYFFIRETDGITKVRCADVAYIESMGDFSKIYTLQNIRHVTLVSLKNLEKQLPVSIFKRVHRQFIGNMDHIITITSKDILMANNENIPLGPLYRQDILNHVINKKVISRFA
jgi:two-component system LytT family response regulator